MGKYVNYARNCIDRIKPAIEEKLGVDLSNIKIIDKAESPVVNELKTLIDKNSLMFTVEKYHPDTIFMIEDNYRANKKSVYSIAEGIAHELSHLAHSKLQEDQESVDRLKEIKSFSEGFAHYVSLDELVHAYTEEERNHVNLERAKLSQYKKFEKELKPYEMGYKFFRKIMPVIGEDKLTEIAQKVPEADVEVKFPLFYLLLNYPLKGLANAPKFIKKSLKTKYKKMKNGKAPFDHCANFVYLDLDKVDLYGWEDHKRAWSIDSMVKSIEKGKDFPPVYVTKIDDKTYELDSDTKSMNNYGGHHRAVAHYIAGRPLKCKITGDSDERKPECYLHIKDIILFDKGEALK